MGGGGTAGRIGRGLATGGFTEIGPGGAAWNDGRDYVGGKSGKNGGPAAPDFNAAAETQARTSRNDVNSTFGNAQWSRTPDGRWSLNTSMAPGLEKASQNLMGQVSSDSQIDPAAARDQAISAAYGQATSRLDPQWSQREEQTRAQLAAQGLTPGSEAYSREIGNMDRSRNDAYAQAMYGAQTGAGQSAYGQALAARMQPYQQMAALRGIGEGMSSQALAQASPVQALAAQSALYNGQLQNYGIQQQGKNSMMGGAAGLGAAALLAG